MKVLMITPRFIYGGIEKLLLDYFENRKDVKIQYDVLIYTGVCDKELKQHLENLEINMYSLHSDKYRNKIFKRLYEIFQLTKFLKKNPYDVVHIHTTDYKRSIDLGCAKILGVHGRVMHAHSGKKNKVGFAEIFWPLKILFDYTATDYCACSKLAAEYLYSKRIINQQRYTVINNGINMKQFMFSESMRNQMRNKLGISDNVVIGHIGRFSIPKNHMFIIDIFCKLVKLDSKYKLLLVGDGELRHEIEERIVRCHIEDKVILYGTTDNVGKILSAMDIFVLPSLFEGLGIALIEAQCNGLPCIVSESIPDEAIITSNVIRLNLNMGQKVWADRIANINAERVDESEKIEEKGFSIANTVKQLETIYKKYQ